MSRSQKINRRYVYFSCVENAQLIFYLLLPVVAFLYAAVGHGGASGYLALMALFSFAPESMRSTALLLNLFVAGIAFVHFWRAGYFNRNLFVYFAAGSIPLSFIGGALMVDIKLYKVILGVLLLFAVARMTGVFGKENEETKKIAIIPGIITGAIIGFFSGLIGIGGGIILTPVIVLMKWGKMKEAAAVSALFIWVNSASGMMGQFYRGVSINSNAWIMVALAVLGGFLGGYYGSFKYSNRVLTWLLSFVLLMASIKLMFV